MAGLVPDTSSADRDTRQGDVGMGEQPPDSKYPGIIRGAAASTQFDPAENCDLGEIESPRTDEVLGRLPRRRAAVGPWPLGPSPLLPDYVLAEHLLHLDPTRERTMCGQTELHELHHNPQKGKDYEEDVETGSQEGAVGGAILATSGQLPSPTPLSTSNFFVGLECDAADWVPDHSIKVKSQPTHECAPVQQSPFSCSALFADERATCINALTEPILDDIEKEDEAASSVAGMKSQEPQPAVYWAAWEAKMSTLKQKLQVQTPMTDFSQYPFCGVGLVTTPAAGATNSTSNEAEGTAATPSPPDPNRLIVYCLCPLCRGQRQCHV
jgi:hypothetical protein